MANLTSRRPLRVPKDAGGPIPPPGPEIAADGPPEAPFPPPTGSNPFAAAPAPAPDLFDDAEEGPDMETGGGGGIDLGKAMHEAQRKKIALRKLPPLPPRLKFEEFIDYWRALNPDQKSHLVIYWYRLRPIIDRKLSSPDNPNYIDVAASDDQMSIEYMTNTHGGGKYHGRVNDTDVRKNGMVAEIFFDINVAQVEPLINLEELDITHRENQAYVTKLKGQGRLTADGRVNKNPTAESKRESNMADSITTRLLDRVLNPPPVPPTNSGPSETATMLNFMLKKMEQEDPTKQLANILGIVAQLTPKPVEDKTLAFLQLMESQRASYEAKLDAMNNRMLELLTRPKESAPDLSQEIDKIKGIAEALGMGSGGGKSSWVDRLIEVAGPAIPAIANIISQRVSAPAAPVGNPGVPRMPNDLTPLTPAGALPAPADATNVTPEETMGFLDSVIANAGSEFITAIANGIPGYAAADSVINLKGRPIYQMIIKDGEEGIIEAIKRNPAFVQQLSRITTEERLAKWIHEFVHADEFEDGPDGDDDDDTGDNLPAAAPTVAKTKKGKIN